MKLIIMSLMSCLVFIAISNAYAQEMGSIEIQVNEWNRDLISPDDTKIVIYQDKSSVFTTLNLSKNPQIITGIPQGHIYSFEIVRHGIHIPTSNIVSLNSDLEKTVITIPPEGGMKFKVYYNDGYTPISEAKVVIRSTSNAPLISTITNNEGQTQRYWLQATNLDEFYFVEINLGTGISYIYSPVRIFPDVSRDFKIITPWPSEINNLITVSIFKNNEKISKDDGLFIIQLYDKKNKMIDESEVSNRGDAFFSKFPVGEYLFKAIKTNDKKTSFEPWGSTKIILTGKENQVIINEGTTGLKIKENGCNCVGFRLDDVQDYSLTQAQMKVIDVFQEKNADLTIGVIGGLIGEDNNIVGFIKEKLQNSNTVLEIASHSWNNSPMTSFSKEKQDTTIKNTNEQLRKIFGVIPTVFIPPENVYNQDTIDVLKSNNFTHLSSSFNYDFPPFPLSGSSFFHFPQGAQTAVFDTESNLWIIEERETIVDDVISSINNHGYAVVMMHPPDFSLNDNGIYRNNFNEKQINELELLIDEIRNLGLKIVPISEINLDSTRIPNPVLENEQMNIVQVVEKSSQISNCNCVAFSLAGIQDYWLNDVQLEILNTFKRTKTDLTVGVIANYFGADEKLLDFFSSTLNDKSSEIEIANNGWEYEDFGKLDLNEQISLIQKSNNKITNVLGVQPVTFLPPLDSTNEVTPIALERNSITVVSSNMINDPPPYNFDDLSYSRIPFGTTTGSYDTESESFKGTSYEETFSKIKENIRNNGFAVVRIYPQEFSIMENAEKQNKVNLQQIKELELLIEEINKNGYQTVPIYKIPTLMSTNVIEIPDWIKNNALWWSNNQISESDFVSGVEYMIQKRIIVIPQIPQSESYQRSEVPNWIKNNAGWWAQELITDEDFVSGLEYLIKNGIITI